jgi:myo-inositol-hexaphosphate 3-phosphohydrolase
MKYAVQNQSGAYDKAGGELTLTKSPDTSTLYDFTNYPMLAGDVVGLTINDAPNGEINGVDFAYVKAESQTHKTVSEGGYLKADLDGNCQDASNDVTVLKLSLEKKQGELY